MDDSIWDDLELYDPPPRQPDQKTLEIQEKITKLENNIAGVKVK